jgi:hypothetical protein
MERCVATAGLDQRVVGAVFDEPGALERDDAIGRAHRGEPVRNNENRAPFCDFLHVLLDNALALVIERAGRFIENQDTRIGDERTRDGDALALTAGARCFLAPNG